MVAGFRFIVRFRGLAVRSFAVLEALLCSKRCCARNSAVLKVSFLELCCARSSPR